jgi:hypothetical protein
MARRATAAALIAVLVLRLLHDVMVAELFEAAIVLGVIGVLERRDHVEKRVSFRRHCGHA